MIAHIRRTDEINVTECDLLTDYDAEVTNEPITMGKRGHRALFPEVEIPASWRSCRACHTAYFAICS
jgi:hypothetical protein